MEKNSIFSIFAKMTAQSLERMDMIDNIPVMSDISGEEELNQFDISYENVSSVIHEQIKNKSKNDD